MTESHQSSKKDTSGTAKAIVDSFKGLGLEFDVSQVCGSQLACMCLLIVAMRGAGCILGCSSCAALHGQLNDAFD